MVGGRLWVWEFVMDMVTAAVDRQQQLPMGGNNRSNKCMPGTEDPCCALKGNNSSNSGLKLEARTDWTSLKFGSNGFEFEEDTEMTLNWALQHGYQDHGHQEGFCFRDDYDAYN